MGAPASTVLRPLSSHDYDVAIIGGGIIGLATAHRLITNFPGKEILLLEKEDDIATHQTGHNSGVLHTGVYYRPGSLKAENCTAGKRAIEEFCHREGISFERCGKVIVATSEREIPVLESIYERGVKNGVRCEVIGPDRLKEIEPHAAGIRAIWVPEAGIINYRQVSEVLAERVLEGGGEIVARAEVRAAHRREKFILETSLGEFSASIVINCAGLYSDRVAAILGGTPQVKIIPFRGEYYKLTDQAKHLCRNLIYPVPDPNFPFLGVHFTRMIGGAVECGPNAVLAFAREGYGKLTCRGGELLESITYPGFIRLAVRYWRTGLGEIWRSVSKAAFVRALQRLVPEISADHLLPAPAGVRAQAVSRDGKLVDDFVIDESPGVINVLNAPSPAATSSLNIAKVIVEKLTAQW